MKPSASAHDGSDDFKDLSSLLKSYMNADGVIDPDKAPDDMKDLLAKLQDVQKLARNNKQAGITITPEPGFVIKSVDEKGKKVFINVCGSPSVLAPGGWKNGQMSEEVRTALERAELEDPGETLRFPLSMGEMRLDQDHKGQACHVLDIVFNIDVLKQAETFRKLKIFLVELAMGWASQKHSVALDPNWKLPKMRYKGDKVQSQRLRLDRKPLVTDLGDVLDEPSFPLVADKKQGSTPSASTATLDPAKQEQKPQAPPEPSSSAAASPEKQVIVQVPGAAPLELRLPFGVDANLGTACVEDEGKRLSLRLPFKPYRSFVNEGRQDQETPFDYMNCSYMQMEA
ncbi:hypothetical protein COCSUDRAFT_41800 [Coccomyxa subellipsoidea C-169]|uniref:PIH1 N-terminal domain-containing protein n=1 Tax=Coccomyxa subellipsoidea (strain C-169) TaxID=574566 RepID=I0YYZ3_COCSC|nr:hypothetical protein COCSUDRAFT_41800 [Coccomyxa subellipsoidea C-169]EIE23612.1 hypothetical protein COCSUDRAFT_41800 [Coccomyxa subellipsoidea C-169]|eukprot:XP_005648156.1 hypothetical protein COCSUDRAFT_41800 [Coccomyxa subellipsoidea C-169]